MARLAAFASGAALFGAPLFLLYSLPRDARPVGAEFRAWVAVFSGIVAVSALAVLAAQTAMMAGDPRAALDPATLGDILAGSAFGRSILVRFGAGLAALALALLVRPGRWLWTVLSLFGGLSMAALAWSGHGAADEGVAGGVHLAADLLHLLGAGVWLGALAALLLLLRRPPEAATLHSALAGFSGVGSAAVAVIVASGLLNTWFLVGLNRLASLIATPWGLLLLAKLALFAAMLGLAALNRFRLTPRLGAALASEPAAALPALRRSIVLEAMLGVGVLSLVSAMGILQPPAAA